MATYNGDLYIKKQLESILSQLDTDDECIISDDGSTDNTLKIIETIADKRVQIFKNKTLKSPIFNFENAIKQSCGDIIVLSDQDDIWGLDKIEYIKKNIHENVVWLDMYNGNCIDSDGKIIKNDLFKYLDVREGLSSNIKKNSFIGCNIAFSKELLKYVIPFPNDIPMHDMWLGCCAYMFGEVKFLDKHIFSYRLHDKNFTNRKVGILQKLIWRYQLIKNLLIRRIKIAFT
ncbi:MAG: glycosyltransferase involved in cell wall biosynthesis [Sulfurimonas sp.]|jgi:glycosyltransferase involved in cell wall biosynthesis